MTTPRVREILPPDSTHGSAPVSICDICHEPIIRGERFHDDGSEIAHTACITGWFSRNYGREGIA